MRKISYVISCFVCMSSLEAEERADLDYHRYGLRLFTWDLENRNLYVTSLVCSAIVNSHCYCL